ncbi:MAG TPA: hypothetical protein VGM59_17315, partial [Dongiaceae bacterium]
MVNGGLGAGHGTFGVTGMRWAKKRHPYAEGKFIDRVTRNRFSGANTGDERVIDFATEDGILRAIDYQG